jgi:hypothetical protein
VTPDEAVADGDTERMPAAAAATVLAAEAVPAGAGKQLSGTAAIAALEKFYRTIVRARDAKPPAAPHVSGA